MVFQDGEMPETTPAHVKFTGRSWFGLKKTYKVVEQTVTGHNTLCVKTRNLNLFSNIVTFPALDLLDHLAQDRGGTHELEQLRRGIDFRRRVMSLL